ncbi:hypothetical protein FXO37_23078 [Capsicum annuum]|nr:hypothetical protein FXO37_23078 [Capsicum annuum]
MTAFQTSAPNRTLWVSDLQISAPNFQISAPNFSDLRKYLASTPEEYAKRNYANNKAKYGTVIASLTAQQRQLSIIHTDLKPENVLLCSTIDPSKDPRKSGKPLILPNHKDKTTLDGGAPKGYVTLDENLIKNHHKKIRRKAKQAAQFYGK